MYIILYYVQLNKKSIKKLCCKNQCKFVSNWIQMLFWPHTLIFVGMYKLLFCNSSKKQNPTVIRQFKSIDFTINFISFHKYLNLEKALIFVQSVKIKENIKYNYRIWLNDHMTQWFVHVLLKSWRTNILCQSYYNVSMTKLGIKRGLNFRNSPKVYNRVY